MTFRHEIAADVIADSISPDGVRLTTMCVTYNRFIIAEVDTHRKFSRSSASSRAIPFPLQLDRAEQFPAPFVEYASEKPGMSGGTELTGEDLYDGLKVLSDIQHFTNSVLRAYHERHPDPTTRLHKSILNRPLEWYGWTTTVITSSEWDNFFRQRAHPAAQPEFRELAYKMRDALEQSVPKELTFYEWHKPWARFEDDDLPSIERLQVSVARCARTSYLNHDGEFSHDADRKLYDETLAKYGHWAPLEHVAVVLPRGLARHLGNFDLPWHQFRHFIEHEATGLLDSILSQEPTR